MEQRRSKRTKQTTGDNNNSNTNKKATTKTNTTQSKRVSKRKKILQQHSLNFRNLDKDDVEEFGDIMQFPLPAGTLRLVNQNIGILPEGSRMSKSRQLVDFLVHSQASVFTGQEIGLYWPKLNDADQWCHRVFGKFQSSSSIFAYNSNEPSVTSKFQAGGVGIVTTDDICHRIIERGRDPLNLGRWCWILLEGRQHHRTRILTAYRPCDSQGAATTYQQHQRQYHRSQRDINPRQALLDDLFTQITEWKNAGNKVIVTMDANEDIRTGAIADLFRALDMKEQILSSHTTLSPPATQNRNQQRQPIDGIWATPGIHAVQAGYLPFGEGCPSDHRAIWIDIDFKDVFGYCSHPFVLPSARRLKASDPRLVKRYNSLVRQKLESAGIFSRLDKLVQQAYSDGWSSGLEAEYNHIHRISTSIRLRVEEKIRKLRMGTIPWSPKLQVFRDKIELWSCLYKKRIGLKMSSRRIRRLLKKVNVGDENVYLLSIKQVEARLKSAHSAYKDAKTHAEMWRDDFLESLAQARATRKGTTKEVELKAMLTIERQRRSARNIKRMRGKLQRSATDRVFVTELIDGVPTRRCATEKLDIEQVAMRENDSRFSQSEDTPPMTKPLLSSLGYADGPAILDIVNGLFSPPEGTDMYSKLLLDEMTMPPTVRNSKPLATTISTDEHKSGWAKQRENTSSEPSGLSFSHFKAASEDDRLCNFDATLRTLPYHFGFSPYLWQQIVDVEILKKAGVYDIEGMRTITLMNAEFQMNNKKLGRDMMANAEATDSMAPEQNGSRRWHRSIFAALIKRVANDTVRLQRRSLAIASMDLKSCYDRMVLSIAALSMLRLGAPRTAVASMTKTLQQAYHRVRTAYGVSDESFGGDERHPPLQGMGQGNGAGPAGWAAVSTPLINMVKRAGYGFRFLSAISRTPISFLGTAFVDDTDVMHSAVDNVTAGETIHEQMQSCVDYWEGGVKATGGAVRPDKSYWYLIDFIWTGSKWRYRSVDEMPGQLDVRNASGTREVIERMEPDEAKETLGVFLSVDGNFQEQVTQLREKTTAFAHSVRTGFLNRTDSWLALTTTIMKTLEYPLVAITLTKKQWDYILSPALTASLPLAGFV